MSSHPQTQTTSDLAAVAEALRSHERFAVTTHENPDGGALGPRLSAHLALQQPGRDSVKVIANTTPKALRLAGELVEAGADFHRVFQGVYETVQFAKAKLLARALERMEIYEGGRIVVTYLLKTDFAEVGAAEPYSEGIIDHLRA